MDPDLFYLNQPLLSALPSPSSSTASTDNLPLTILLTGANSGLGFEVLKRLIDTFYSTRPPPQRLHLLFTTRDAKKGAATQRLLNAHVTKAARLLNDAAILAGKGGLSPSLIESRVRLENVVVDLGDLAAVKRIGEEFAARAARGKEKGEEPFGIDVAIWNAGIAGWTHVNYLKATWECCVGLVKALTRPGYMVSEVGKRASAQLRSSRPLAIDGADGPSGELANGDASSDEPPLGQVFTANVFGHYMLSHYIASALRKNSARLIWISSTSATADRFDPSDLQGLRSLHPYEHSKRLTDLLALSSELSSCTPYMRSLFGPSPTTQPNGSSSITSNTSSRSHSPPTFILTHPGIINTSIATLSAPMAFLMLIAFYAARLVFGSPWHAIDAYKGAVSVVIAALAPLNMIEDVMPPNPKAAGSSIATVNGSTSIDGATERGQGIKKRGGAQVTTTELSVDCGRVPGTGKHKLGARCSRLGEESVALTDVEGWGFDGVVSSDDSSSPPAAQRKKGVRGTASAKAGASSGGDGVKLAKLGVVGYNATGVEERTEFEGQAINAWREMEALRAEWCELLERDARG